MLYIAVVFFYIMIMFINTHDLFIANERVIEAVSVTVVCC